MEINHYFKIGSDKCVKYKLEFKNNCNKREVEASTKDVIMRDLADSFDEPIIPITKREYEALKNPINFN